MSGQGLSPLPMKYIEGKVISSPLLDLDQPQHTQQSSETQRMRELELLLNEAQTRSQDVEREAYDKAYAAGEQAGMDLGRKRAEQITRNMEGLLQQCGKSAQLMQEQIDEAVLDIADAVIRHILDTLLEEHPDYIKQMIARATRLLPEQRNLCLAVSVHDMAMFERLLGDTPSKLIADDNIAPGTCRIMASDHDILIDPQAAISECMQHIRGKLLHRENAAAEDEAAGPAED